MPKRVISPSNVPRIPTIRSRDRDLAALLNKMGVAINALAKGKPTVAAGKRQSSGTKYPDLFEPLSIAACSGGEIALLKMQTPNVREIIPQTGVDSIVVHDVYYDSAIVTTETTIPVPSGSWVMCKVVQTSLGAVETSPPPTIVVDTELTASDHWYPPDPEDDAGAIGTMYYPLYQISITASVPSIDVWHVGPIEITQDLWHGISDTAGAKVLIEQDESARAAYRFRSIVGITPILVEESGDAIDVSIDGGWWGSVVWSIDNQGTYNTLAMTFEGGILKTVSANGGNTTQAGSGTDNDPGSATISAIIPANDGGGA